MTTHSFSTRVLAVLAILAMGTLFTASAATAQASATPTPTPTPAAFDLKASVMTKISDCDSAAGFEVYEDKEIGIKACVGAAATPEERLQAALYRHNFVAVHARATSGAVAKAVADFQAQFDAALADLATKADLDAATDGLASQADLAALAARMDGLADSVDGVWEIAERNESDLTDLGHDLVNGAFRAKAFSGRVVPRTKRVRVIASRFLAD